MMRRFPTLIRTLTIACFFALVAQPVAAQDASLDTLDKKIIDLFKRDDFKAALPIAEKYAELIKAKFGESDVQYARALNNIGSINKSLKNFSSAEKSYREALKVAETALGGEHEYIGVIAANLANALTPQKKFDEAEVLLIRALTIREEKLGSENREVALALDALSKLYAAKGEGSKAVLLHKRAIAIRTKLDLSDKRNFADGEYIAYPVFYATDRFDTGHKKASKRYGSKRSVTQASGFLDYGICKVSIPGGVKRNRGELPSPSMLRLEFRNNPSKHVVLLEVNEMEKERYFASLRKRIGASPSRKAFVFIHGYNVTFEDAARRTAQMAYDLEFKGAPIFYSWPSKGSTYAYTSDETNIQWTELHLKRFLIDFLDKSDAEEVYIIAHSMGNRAMTRVVADVAIERPVAKQKFKEIILAAPDIDAGLFRDAIAPRLTNHFKNVTLYASEDDHALGLSKWLHGIKARAGDAGKHLVVVPKVETIDVSKVDSSLLGHSYIAGAASVLSDVGEIIFKGLRAKKRSKMQEKTKQNRPYWEMQK